MKKYFSLIILFFIALSLSARPRCDRKRPLENHPYPKYEMTRADSATGFDILHYDISITIDDQNEFISGNVITIIEAEEDLTEINFELEILEVDNVLLNGVLADYTFSEGIITINLDDIESGDIFETTVFYSGTPEICTNPYPLGMFFFSEGIYTISDPNASRYWWPCYDHPWDKAEVDLHITVREDWEVASNGIRTEITTNEDNTRTHHWEGSNPMATYLVSIVTRNFSELNDMYNDIPIHNFVSPSQEADALEDFSNLPFMMETYSQLYGEYPFEKYGNAVTNFSTYAAMEHQTMTTLSSYMIGGEHAYETIIAHELSHQWFGNCLTCLTWKDIWLSEGFATYSEALYMEQWQGFDAMIDYVKLDIQNYYINWAGNTGHITYDPPYSSLFNPSTYEKPASVLHMLRLLVGNDTFFDILQTYFQTYKNGNVITEDFIEVAENISGLDLQQFFQQWIFEAGIPQIDYMYFISNDPNTPQIITYAKSSCVNANTDFYISAPVHLNYETTYDSVLVQAGPEIIETVSNINSINYESIQFDPNSWILNRGYTNHTTNINNAFASDENVIIFWNNIWEDVVIDGFNLYRSISEDGEYLKINEELITTNYYEDNSVENNETYYYRLKAVKEVIFETPFSDTFSATPIAFPMDQGILIIDETKDGNGTPGNPTDEMVDNFYAEIIGMDFDNYDYAELGSISLEQLANYSTVIWHDDDINFHNIDENINNLGCYLVAGGNLIISGWRTSDVIEDYFLSAFLDLENMETVPTFIFNQANSEIYPTLNVDPEKINTALGGCLAYITTFPEAENAIYTFQSAEGSEFDGVPCAVESQPNGKFILLGFPLYYMQNDQAAELMNTILDDLGEADTTIETITQVEIELTSYPNPFSSRTDQRGYITISYNLPEDSETELSVFNAKGQKITTIFTGYQPAGEYEKNWDGNSENGIQVSSGVYFYKLTTGKYSIMNKMIIIK